MRIAYLECFSGISGDMFMGALVDAGVAPADLEDAVAALHVGARLEISRVVRAAGYQPLKVDVWVDGEKDLPRGGVLEATGPHSQDLVAPASPPAGRRDGALRRTLMSMSMGGITHSHAGKTRTELPLRHSSGQAEPVEGECPRHTSILTARALMRFGQIISAALISETAKEDCHSHLLSRWTGRGEDSQYFRLRASTSTKSVLWMRWWTIVCAAGWGEALGVDEIIFSPLNVGGGTVKVRARDFPCSGSGNSGVVGGGSGLFVWTAGRIGYRLRARQS